MGHQFQKDRILDRDAADALGPGLARAFRRFLGKQPFQSGTDVIRFLRRDHRGNDAVAAFIHLGDYLRYIVLFVRILIHEHCSSISCWFPVQAAAKGGWPWAINQSTSLARIDGERA